MIEKRKKRQRNLLVILSILCCLFMSGCSFLPQREESVQTELPFKTEKAEKPEKQKPPAKPKVDLLTKARNLIPHFDDKYYIGQLHGKDLENFCVIYESMMGFKKYCVLPYPVTTDRLDDYMLYMRSECPELLQFSWDGYEYFWEDEEEEKARTVFLPYLMNEKTYREVKAQTETVIRQLCQSAAGLSDYEKEMLVYRYIIENCTYNDETENTYNAYGVFVEKEASCEGYAKAMAWAMQEMGIPCMCIAGDNKIPGEAGHMWNIICIDGVYYDLDLTQDDMDEEDVWIYGLVNIAGYWQRERFNIYESYKHISVPDYETMDSCYHAKNGSYFTSKTELRKWLREQLDAAYEAGGASIVFQIEDSELYEELKDKALSPMIDEWGEDRRVRKWSYDGWNVDESNTTVLNIEF